VAVAAGAPPSLVFAARLLDLQSALEAGEITAFFALAGAVAWVWGLAAGARALLLPQPAAISGGSPLAVVVLSAFTLAAGAAAGVIATTLAMPAAAGVMTFPRSALTGGSLALVAASGAWPAVTLAGPLLVAAARGGLTLGLAGTALGLGLAKNADWTVWLLAGAGLLAAALRARDGDPGWGILPQGSTPRVILSAVAGAACAWVGGSLLVGP